MGKKNKAGKGYWERVGDYNFKWEAEEKSY